MQGIDSVAYYSENGALRNSITHHLGFCSEILVSLLLLVTLTILILTSLLAMITLAKDKKKLSCREGSRVPKYPAARLGFGVPQDWASGSAWECKGFFCFFLFKAWALWC